MSVREWTEAGLAEENECALFADGFDEALIGHTVYQPGPRKAVPVYDLDKMLDILVERDGMSLDEAQEYIDFNVTGAWMGENTPLFAVSYPAKDDLARDGMINS
jgi:hypothetical protein